MDWKKERDELIAQTLAFVQSVSAQLPDAAQWRLTKPELPPVSPPAACLQPEISAPLPVQAAEPPVRSNAAGPSAMPSTPLAQPSIHSEVEQRIASFRAHQERFNRERAEYFSATIARLRATLQDAPPPRSSQIARPRD
jgi:hypothetical protein